MHHVRVAVRASVADRKRLMARENYVPSTIPSGQDRLRAGEFGNCAGASSVGNLRDN